MKKNFCLLPLFLLLNISLTYPQADSSYDISDISLEELLGIPVQSASRTWQKISQAPASVSLITSGEIEKYGFKNLSEVLQYISGFYTSNDRNYSYAGIRGFSRPSDYNNRILLLINGHRLNENVYNSALIGNEFGLDLSIIDRIEIVKGPGSVLYGTDAMLATINIITVTPGQFEGLKISGEYGSLNRKKAIVNFGGNILNELNFFLNASAGSVDGEDFYYEEYDSDSTNHGIAENLDKDEYAGMFTNLQYKDFKISLSSSYRKKIVPTAPYGTIFNTVSSTIDRRSYLELTHNAKLNELGELSSRIFYDIYSYDGFFPSLVDSDTLNFLDHSEANLAGAEMQFTYNMLENNVLIAGLEYNYNSKATYTYWDQYYTIFDGNFSFSKISFFLQDDFQPFNNLTLVAGLRLENYSERETNIVPRAGIIYKLSGKSNIKILYGEGYRVPNLYEKFYFDPYSSFKASTNLKPERISTTELVYENFFSKRVQFIFNLFNNNIKNLIDTWVDPADSMYQFINLGKVSAFGLSLELISKFSRDLHGFINYTYSESKDAERDVRLTNAPLHILNMGATYSLTEYLDLSALFHFESDRVTVYQTKSPSFFLSDMNILWHTLENKLSMLFSIKNVFDKKYNTPGSFEHLQNSIEQEGRQIILRVNYEIF